MNKNEGMLISQIFSGMEEILNALEEAQRKKDKVGVESAKKEILGLKNEVDKLL